MVEHPLALGRIRTNSPVIYTVNSPQRIRLSTIKLMNRDNSDINVKLSIFARGAIVGITPGIDTVTIPAGHTLEVMSADEAVYIDQGNVILGIADKDAVIEYIIDGKEDTTMES